MANPLYGQNKFDNASDFITGDRGEAYIKRNVINMGATTAVTQLTAAQSGSLIMLDSTASQIQVINLPTIKAEDIGCNFEFFVDVIGNSGAAGSYTINTGGHATDENSVTAGYDDYHPDSCLLIVEPTIVATADKLVLSPGASEGAMILADDTTNAVLKVGTRFTMTAVKASTIGTANADVWLVDGILQTSQATGFVTTNLFTAP